MTNQANLFPAPLRRRLRAVTQAALAAAVMAMLGACGTTSITGTSAAAGAQTSTSPASTASPTTTASPAPTASSADWGEPIRFVCNGKSPFGVIARFRRPDPSSMTLQRGDGTVELHRQPTASGVRYASANVEFSEHQGDVRLRWGSNAAPLRCMRQR